MVNKTYISQNSFHTDQAVDFCELLLVSFSDDFFSFWKSQILKMDFP